MSLHKNRTSRRDDSPMSSEQPDGLLVAAVLNGDRSSFEVLARRYERMVLAVGRRTAGSAVDAEDIAQQTFMKAFAGLGEFEGRSSFSTWLTSIAMNEARMWKRRRSRSGEIPYFVCCDEQGRMEAVPVADPRPNPESASVEKERAAMVRRRVNQLNPATRIAVELCDLQEKSARTAALLLGITVAAVKSRRSRGRAALRIALAGYRNGLHPSARRI